MKKGNLGKKLVLSKSTIVNLNHEDSKNAKGGLPWTDPRVCNSETQCATACNGDCETAYYQLCPTVYYPCLTDAEFQCTNAHTCYPLPDPQDPGVRTKLNLCD